MSDRESLDVLPASVTITCAAPGPAHTFEWTPRSGRKPKFCPQHRRSAGTERSQAAYDQRRRGIAEEVRSAELTREVGRISRLAAGLRVYRNPELAARFVGIDATGPELAELVARARAEHPSVITGDMRDTAHLAEAAVHVLLTECLERRAEMPARDLAHFARFALQARQELIGDGPPTNYVSINLGIVPPPSSGKLTEEQRARVQGVSEE